MDPYSKDELAPIEKAIDRRNKAVEGLTGVERMRWSLPENPVYEIRLQVEHELYHGNTSRHVTSYDARISLHIYEHHLINYALGALEKKLGDRDENPRVQQGNRTRIPYFTSTQELEINLGEAVTKLKKEYPLAAGSMMARAEADVKAVIDAKIAEMKTVQSASSPEAAKPAAVRGHQPHKKPPGQPRPPGQQRPGTGSGVTF